MSNEYPINDAVTGATALNLVVSDGAAVINDAVTGRTVYNMPTFPGGGSSVLTKVALAASAVGAIPCEDSKAYTYTPTGTTNFGFATSGIPESEIRHFELHVTQGSTVQTISFPNTVLWDDGTGKFSAENSAPEAATANKVYKFVFRVDGGEVYGNLAIER